MLLPLLILAYFIYFSAVSSLEITSITVPTILDGLLFSLNLQVDYGIADDGNDTIFVSVYKAENKLLIGEFNHSIWEPETFSLSNNI